MMLIIKRWGSKITRFNHTIFVQKLESSCWIMIWYWVGGPETDLISTEIRAKMPSWADNNGMSFYAVAAWWSRGCQVGAVCVLFPPRSVWSSSDLTFWDSLLSRLTEENSLIMWSYVLISSWQLLFMSFQDICSFVEVQVFPFSTNGQTLILCRGYGFYEHAQR